MVQNHPKSVVECWPPHSFHTCTSVAVGYWKDRLHSIRNKTLRILFEFGHGGIYGWSRQILTWERL